MDDFYYQDLSLKQAVALEDAAMEIGKLKAKLDESARVIIRLTAQNAGMLDAHRNLLTGVHSAN